MKNKKTMTMLVLVLVSSILMTTLTVQASGNSIRKYTNVKGVKVNTQSLTASPKTVLRHAPTQTRSTTAAQVSNVVKPMEDIHLEEVNDEIIAEIDSLVQAYEELPEEEKKPNVPGVWVVVARGLSWKGSTMPEVSETAPESIPMGIRFFAKAIWGNKEWTLYRLGRGIIGHDGERYRVDGYALYKKETGKFCLVLDGDGVSLQAVGKVYGRNADLSAANCCRCLRLAMKGRMSINGDSYVFALRGYAFRLRLLRAKPIVEAEIQTSA
jgi:hypothetical protein